MVEVCVIVQENKLVYDLRLNVANSAIWRLNPCARRESDSRSPYLGAGGMRTKGDTHCGEVSIRPKGCVLSGEVVIRFDDFALGNVSVSINNDALIMDK